MSTEMSAAYEAARPLAQDAFVLRHGAELPLQRLDAIAPGGRVLCLAHHAPAGGVSADEFLLRMAARGFFPDTAHALRSPAGSAWADETLNLFTRHDFTVRPAREADLAALLRLERRCWVPGTRTAGRWLRRRMAQFARGQLVLVQDGEVVGAVYSQRVDSEDVQGLDAVTVHARHRPAGPIVQLLALNVLPQVQDRGHGDLLLEFVLQRCAVMEGVTTVIGVTRCRDYAAHSHLPVDDYIRLRDARGQLVDPVLRFHALHGAMVREAVPGYRPRDAANRGCGVLVRYDVHGRVRPAAEAGAQAPATATPLREKLVELLERGGRAVPLDRPLFEAGLDSADLLSLREALRTELGVAVEPGFFFEHNTGERVLAYLRQVLGPLPGPAAADPAAGSQPAGGTDAIAVVGMACLFPGGATDPQRFWELLWEGRDAIAALPAGRWEWPPGIAPDGAHRGIALGGFVDGVDRFDARFFRISPREARQMDPQQRLALQLAWACLEDAGWPADEVAGSSTGVFIGASGSDYQQRWSELLAGDVGPDFALCGATALIANRVSYFLDLRGPSQQVDTACSSSLVALHEAVQALRRGECAQALVGGVNVLCHPNTSIAYYKAGMLSPDGRCRTFDAGANGYVRGEGAAMVLLKPLVAAERDGDRIQAVIRGTARNHGGQAAGLTVPNPAQQAQLVLQACAAAGLQPQALGYVEAHGTGTPLGDPVEVQGLRQAFAQAGASARCGLGSVKTNIGHLEAAAGLAGLMKVVLALQRRRLPASLHLREPNPHLGLAGTPFHLLRERGDWAPAPGQALLRAGVSSFGSGGTNAHAILEEYAAPRGRAAAHDGRPLAIVLSARDEERLHARVRQLLEALDGGGVPDAQLPDLAYTLQTGRQAMPARLGMLAASMAQLRQALAAFLAGGQPAGLSVVRLAEKEAEPAVRPSGQAEALAQWMQGRAIDWRSLYPAPRPRRIGLPTYPFAPERHWLPEAAAPVARAGTAAPQGKPTGIVLAPVDAAGAPPVRADAPAVPAPVAPQAHASQAAPPERPRAEGATVQRLERELAESLAEALLMDAADVRPEAQFVGLGLDSISGVEWVRTLNRRHGLSLAATVVYAHPSVRQLAAHLAGLLPGPQPAAPAPVPATPAAPAPVPATPPPVVRRPAPAPATESARAAPAGAQPIAIVGMAGRYPGSPDLDAFWDTIAQGRDAVTEVPPSRWPLARYHDPRPQTEGKTYGKWLGVLDGVDEFDPAFFGLSAAEAEVMDPQQRLFLQEAWRALEDAGIAPGALAGSRSGVYLGLSNNEYAHLLRTQGPGLANRLGNSLAIAAARIAYRLDLKGPAIALDTACSSSLVAAHLAVQALQAGQIDLALAGGASLYLTPELHILMSSMGMLAPDGRCKPFDDRADGIVPGEGVGVLVLKRLADAERDGDPIHGVILASGINQDGKTNGITAPSLASQAELVRELYARHGIHPDSISYVEMHGTGTRLGDPIELEALASAFGHWTARRQFCRVGSVKANIGHVTAAAGVAGVHKVLLSMRRREFGPLPHFRVPNAHFDFAASPFVVGTERCAWDAPAGTRRRAAVSSFGISGTNAHLVLEEWVAPTESPSPPAGPALVVLSARDDERLRARAAQLVKAIAQGRVGEDQLAALAYTLQVGRDAMPARLATAVDSLAQLRERLSAFVRDGAAPQLHVGQARREDAMWASLAHDEDAQDAAAAWLRKGKHAVVMDLWVHGYPVDWRRLHGDAPPRRISLPGYPFARERYWVPAGEGAALLAPAQRLHPLVHRNVSTAAGLCFASTFPGDDALLRDHVVQGRAVLPATAQLEMARAAVALAAELQDPSQVVLGPVAWEQPLAVEAGTCEVELSLRPGPDGAFGFEIAAGPAGARRVGCRGHARVQAPAAGERIVPGALQARFTAAAVPAARCQELYAARGLHYGPAYRGLVQLQVQGDEVLARWVLPDAAALEDLVLQPGVLDAALQATIGWRLEDAATSLPFALDRLEILGDCPAQGWAWLRRGGEGGAPRKIDVDLFDDEGRPYVRLRGFSSRVLPVSRSPGEEPGRLMVHAMRWQPAPLPEGTAGAPGWILLDAPFAPHAAALQAACPGARCQLLAGEGGIGMRYRQAALQLLELLQGWQRGAPQAPLRVQLVLPAQGEGALLRGLAGMLQAARAENPLLQGQVLLLPADMDATGIASALNTNAGAADVQVRMAGGAREALRPEAVTPPPASAPWRSDGVYLITGGLGGIGLRIAGAIARDAPGAVVVLSGRAPLDDGRRRQLQAVAAAGARAVYRQADVADALAVRGLVEGVVEEFGALHCVLHCAGVLRDGFLAGKGPADLRAVLAPKVDGVLALDDAIGALPIGQLVLFSSISAVRGGVGQTDYAAANGFLDAFAAWRNALAAQGRRHGRTVSVNWPYWAEGGMGGAATHEKLRAEGRRPLATDEALAVLHGAMAGDADQWLVVAHEVPAPVVAPIRLQPAVPVQAPAAGGPVRDPALEATSWLKRVLANRTKRPVDGIDAAAPLEDYGIDSILVLQLTADMEKRLGPLSRTLFFEHATLASLAQYLVRAHPQAWSLVADAVPARAAPAEAVAVAPSPWLPAARTAAPARGDVAIVGMAGRYPEARDVHAYWRVLAQGLDCITDIPAERWDWRAYFDADKDAPGKAYTRWGGFIEGVAEFDPLFFNISPREAAALDPQERLFLQCAHEALEDAGHSRERIARMAGGKVGVFVGAMYHEYQLYGAQEQARGRQIALSGSASSIANRVSYFFNLHGPSLALDTMCSSSLTAIHLACEALRAGDCEAAIAGGVNVSVHPNKYLLLSQGRFASSKGRCESFGRGGDGYVPGEGVGAVLLKPLDKAVADGDRIWGVIKASAINHGGKTNGYTVPNPTAQAELIRQALDKAGVNARAISYVEAHGTGTALGDPIEIAGLAKAFEADTQDRQYCAIGSAKSNIGHCESAAGIAGLTKVLLQLRHGQLAPSLHAQQLNPNIEFERTPFVVQRQLGEWKRPVVEGQELPRTAGISSFGAGGANAHLIVQEYRAPERVKPGLRPVALVLSARNEERLKAQAAQLLDALEGGQWQEEDLADIAYTLQVGREAMEQRLAMLVENLRQACDKLRAFVQGQPDEGLFTGQVKRGPQPLRQLTDDEDFGATVQQWIAHGKQAKLVALWVAGGHVDWARLWEGHDPQVVGLPTYPFARDRYWIDLGEAPAEEAPAPQRAARFLVQGWQPQPLQARREVGTSVLVVACGEAMPLARRLAQRCPGAQVLDLDDPQARVDAQATAWVDLSGCAGETGDRRWIALLQQWLDGAPVERVALGITRGLLRVGDEDTRTAGSLQAGLYRMLSHEYQRLQARHVDLDARWDEDTCAHRIVEELRGAGGATQVAWRGDTRHAGVLAPARLAAGAARQEEAFGPDDTVWITGGTRGLGALCARHLVTRHGVRRLVLGGRDALPSRDEWPRHRERDDDTGRKVRAIEALEALGARVWPSAVALADAAGVAQELERIRAAFGPVTGWVHAAGAIDSATPAFVRKTADAMARVLSPKVDGAQVLLQALAAGGLRRAVLFSSVSAAVPRLAVGQADYAMANSHLDRLAESWAGRLDIVSLQWPSWKDTGFGESRSAAYQATGLLTLRDEEGLALLDEVLRGRPGPVVLPALVDPRRFDAARLLQPPAAPAGRAGAAGKPASEVAREEGDHPVQAAGAAGGLQAWLMQLAARQLRVPEHELDPETPLADYGADSVMLAQLLRPVSERVGQRLDPSIVYEHGSVAALARWLLAQHPVLGREEPAPPPADPPRPADAPSAPSQRADVVRERAEPMAIVGMAGRFPGAADIDAYWRLLSGGACAIAPVPPSRWGGEGSGHFAALLEDVDRFDPAFFLLGEADARAMDPQARLLLEEGLRLWHHAGYRPEEVRGQAIGVYVGGRSAPRPRDELLAQARNPVVALGQNYLAANVSRFFDLRGASVVVDTACSSALTALHMAMQALAAGDMAAAMVGGVSVLHTAAPLALFARRGILQREPRFHLFDGRAGGVVLGEGCGWVLLKPWSRAQADGDTVYALVEAAAINSDGRTAGPVAPNVQAQREVMLRALARSGRAPGDIGHVEVNGSGSEVTDLLELKAIEAVYRDAGGAPLELGSIKPNIGHPLCAEGIAALIKLALMLHHGQRVPFLSAQEPMAHYDFTRSPLSFSRSAQPWGDLPPAVALNCFGDGGSNAHVVMARAPAGEAPRRTPLPPPVLRRIDLEAPRATEDPPPAAGSAIEPLFWEEAAPCK